ncbi:hypothetical protein TNCV_498141 [Trichonephila clavipes]|nr:hypothetical protein TNCV_498141 [Trichonephila clavipes]
MQMFGILKHSIGDFFGGEIGRNISHDLMLGNVVKGFRKCGIETHNPLVFREHDFAASKATDHDVIDDEIENNSVNPQTLAVTNQHINPPEEPEHMANVDYDAVKKSPTEWVLGKSTPKWRCGELRGVIGN